MNIVDFLTKYVFGALIEIKYSKNYDFTDLSINLLKFLRTLSFLFILV